MSGRSVHENRWRGIPSASLTKANQNQYLAVVAASVANNDPSAIPVATTTTAGVVPVGEYTTYTDSDSVMIESGVAILQASAAYAASQNGQGVSTHTTAGVVAAAAKAAGTLTGGTIIGGGTRMVGSTTVNVVYVRGLNV